MKFAVSCTNLLYSPGKSELWCDDGICCTLLDILQRVSGDSTEATAGLSSGSRGKEPDPAIDHAALPRPRLFLPRAACQRRAPAAEPGLGACISAATRIPAGALSTIPAAFCKLTEICQAGAISGVIGSVKGCCC